MIFKGFVSGDFVWADSQNRYDTSMHRSAAVVAGARLRGTLNDESLGNFFKEDIFFLGQTVVNLYYKS